MSEYTVKTEEARWYASNHGRMPVEWFDRWLDAERARVWDEGHLAGASDGTSDDWVSVNPYEREANDE